MYVYRYSDYDFCKELFAWEFFGEYDKNFFLQIGHIEFFSEIFSFSSMSES